MLSPSEVSAVIVTRGDVDIGAIIDELQIFNDIVIWDNSKREDLKTFGRYAALPECEKDIVYFQDDDILLRKPTLDGLLAAYEPGVMLANMSPGWVAGRDLHDAIFVGAGAIMDRDLPGKAMAKYDELYDRDDLFHLYPETILSIPSLIKRVDLPLEVLPWGYAPNRMNAHIYFEEWLAESISRGRVVRDVNGGKS